MSRVVRFPPVSRRRRARTSVVPTIRLTMLAAFAGTLAFLNARDGDFGPPVQAVIANRSTDSNWMAPRTAPPEIAYPGHANGGAASSAPRAGGGETVRARFSLCHSGGGTNCVVDGDTFWFGGQKIRIADIDTPETHPPKCAEEAALGAAATERLQSLLNAGPFSLQSADRDTDRYGRKLRIVTRDGNSLGGVLVDEGLARWYGSGRRSWCLG